MFDSYSYSLFNDLPNLPNIDIDASRRTLSRGYIFSLEMQLDLAHKEYLSIQPGHLTEKELEELEDKINDDLDSVVLELYRELRRLGDTLESSCIFDNNENKTEVKASAFVAAESLSLLATILNSFEKVEEDVLLSNEFVYTRLESAMLFLISGYDANALTEVNKISDHLLIKDWYEDLYKIEYWCIQNLVSLLTNTLVTINRDKPFIVKNDSKTLKNLIIDNKIQMFSNIGEAIILYTDWLVGDDDLGYKKSVELLDKIVKSTFKNRFALYPEIYHFSMLLKNMISITSERALLHNIKSPEDTEGRFIEYIKARIKGDLEVNSRPFIWESASKFIEECLPGPNKHVIVNQPTGSGKSFIAEIAAAQSLSKGWILYLAPTNALVHQIRKDLKKSMKFYQSLEIKSFIGGEEYTKLEEETLDADKLSENFIAVMTPEKCAMSLRMNPEIFENCVLCIFDECHLLGEGTRGANADLVIGKILSINSNIKFILMSAMINNPDDLAEWLTAATDGKTLVTSISWKPTRSIRGTIGIETNILQQDSLIAKENLKQKMESRKNEKFNSNLSILYSQSGVWKKNYSDYSLLPTNILGKFVCKREKENNKWTYFVEPLSWVNNTSREIGVNLSSNGIPTIVFISTNRHYPFTLGKGISLKSQDFRIPQLEDCLLILAESDLGIESEVRNLLMGGVGVHTSYMLETEKEAVERLFANRHINLLFATGTLAQGLNLPSVAIVIAGTRIGDVRDSFSPEARSRSKALILNAIGRGGRAGFSNQSLSILVPDKPLQFKHNNTDVDRAIYELPVLLDNDASITIRSKLEEFLRAIINKEIHPNEASLEDLTIISSLVSGDEEINENIINTLSKTYAAKFIETGEKNEKLFEATREIIKIKNEFLTKSESPKWTISVARKSGFDFFTTNEFIKVVNQLFPNYIQTDINKWTTKMWLEFLFECMKKLPPLYIQKLLPKSKSQKSTFLNRMLESILIQDGFERITDEEAWDNHWNEFFNITLAYIEGQSYEKIAKMYLSLNGDVEISRAAGKPIPSIIALVKNQVDTLSSYAGLLIATLEESFLKEEEIPFNLNILPIAIKNGLHNQSVYYWFNHGIRNRFAAHVLARIMPLKDFKDHEASKKEVKGYKELLLNNDIEFKDITLEDEKIIEAVKIILKNSI